MRTMHFKSHADYSKWLAYGHMHGLFEETPGNTTILIHNLKHHVRHTR